jgi:hypothetical protein
MSDIFLVTITLEALFEEIFHLLPFHGAHVLVSLSTIMSECYTQ